MKSFRALHAKTKLLLLLSSIVALSFLNLTQRPATAADQVRIAHPLPLIFEANQGQTNPHVKFLLHGQHQNLFLTSNETVLTWIQATVSSSLPVAYRQVTHTSHSSVLRQTLVGGNSEAKLIGKLKLLGKVNYIKGRDPKGWHMDIPTYAQVEAQAVYPGINVLYYVKQGKIEQDFFVAPHADPTQIRLAIAGALETRIATSGELVVKTAKGEERQAKPFIYQNIRGYKHPISGHYIQYKTSEFGFALGYYNHSLPLVIDPSRYSTFLGGSDFEEGNGLAVDSEGNTYIAGSVGSTDFPVTAGALNSSYNGGTRDIFITKLNAGGNGLIYSTYLGGSLEELATAIALDSSGKVYLTGYTLSVDFPVTSGAFDTSYNGGGSDAFVVKLTPSGNTLIYGTYLGSTGGTGDVGFGIAADSSGNAYVTGRATAGDFPTTPAAFDSSYNGVSRDAFVTKLNPTGTSLVYSTFLGGSVGTGTGPFDANEDGNAIAVDSSGSAYVTGFTRSVDFPVTQGAIDSSYNGLGDVFVTKFTPDGSSLVYSTYLGGADNDSGKAIAVDILGGAYVTGSSGADFPVTAGAFKTRAGGSRNSFVTKLSLQGKKLEYSTFLGGSNDAESGQGIAVDTAGNAYIGGVTYASNFPITGRALDPTYNGMSDAFISQLDPFGKILVYSTFIGGSSLDFGYALALDPSNNVYLTGRTTSTDFPKTVGAFDTNYSGLNDAFVTKVRVTPP